MGKHKTDSINYRKPWSPEEDLRLSQLVVIEGTQRWSKIALEMPSRNGKQCRERWLKLIMDDDDDQSVVRGHMDELVFRPNPERGLELSNSDDVTRSD